MLPEPTTNPPKPTSKRGRPLGSLGRRTKEALALADEIKVDPLRYLLKRIKSRRTAPEIRDNLAVSCLPYLYPKLAHKQADMNTDRQDESRRFAEVLHSLSFEESSVLEAFALRLAAPDKSRDDGKGSTEVIDVSPTDPSAP